MTSLLRSFVLLLAGVTVSSLQAQVTLAKWTFEPPPADLNNSTTISGLAADVGTGTASGFHASAATDWSTPTGNGSANALSANTWTIGDYFQFSTSTLSYDSITLSWSQISSGTGPAGFSLQYSTDGTSFTTFANYTVLANASPNTWSSGLATTASNYSYDLSSVSWVSNALTVYFRLTNINTVSANAGTVAAGGTSRVDDFTISGTAAAAIPEPSTYAALAGAAALGLAVYRRRRLAASVA